MRKELINLPRRVKIAACILNDSVGCLLTLWLAWSLTYSGNFLPTLPMFYVMFSALLIFLAIFTVFGAYRMVVRFLGWRSGLRIGIAFAFYTSILLVVCIIAKLSLVFGLMQSTLFFLYVLGSRSFARYFLTNPHPPLSIRHSQQSRAIIYGAGSAGRQLANALIIEGQTRVIAFIDDDINLHGCSLNGLPIFPSSQLGSIILERGVTHLFVAIPSLPRHKKQQLLLDLSALPVAVKSLPTVHDLANGLVHVTDLRPIEVGEVLGRAAVAPDMALLGQDIRGKTVLITGAGGSIGSEIARQVLSQTPSTLVLFEINEYALYSVERELKEIAARDAAPTEIIAILGSITDSDFLLRLFHQFSPNTIYHAAAYKHVPLIEQNPLMGIWNNVIGTWRLVDAAQACAVETFVLISTDKAVRPTNIMGCTKRVAEMILQARQHLEGNRTKLTMVRFGNVLGSSGSVIPVFKAQIQAGGPLTVTHPDIIRYFMTIPEAAQLVIQAGAIGRGGDVMLLDMGDPIKIADLAKKMIHLSGLREKTAEEPEGDIEIIYTGLRPGEKLYEELLISGKTKMTLHPKIWLARENMIPWAELEFALEKLKSAVTEGDSSVARDWINNLVPEFMPQCEMDN